MIALIWAQSANGVIGADGALPWRIPEDMAHFRAQTHGSTVVMGRLTWESLPVRFRPLPGRRNVVVTRNPDYTAPGAEVVGSVPDALAANADVWVAGGAQIYAASIAAADRLVITDVDVIVSGDVFAPELTGEWREARRDPPDGWHTSATGVRFRWRELERA